jgi:type IV pilus biogenesis protein CpaD/CtpE
VLKKLIPVVATLLLVGCSSNPSARDEAIIGLAVQYATAKYIEEKPGSAENIVRVAEGVKALVGGDASATLVTLQEYVGQELTKLELSPADRVLANALVNLVVAELQAKVGEGLLEPDQRVRVAKILDLVIAAARA